MMKKFILFILLLFFVVLVRAQENSEIDYYVCKSKFIAKRVVKRFDKACIAKEWFYENEEYYIELEEGEICEYYKFLGIVKIFCIPRRAICNIREFTVFDDGFIWDDENMEL